MANQMRAQPRRKASMTLVMPATAATETTKATQGRPSEAKAEATGAGLLSVS